jgi:SAM-dependent methyltransferase
MPWQDGDNIPWHEPGFSARMLAEHLTQQHDRASRRSHLIDEHVAWIHRGLLAEKPTHILDLGCGPGLYCSRLAALGHTCVGIDYSPASIAYANEQAKHARLACTYLRVDMRVADFATGYGLVMLLFGELNVFAPFHAANILAKAYDALTPGGYLLLEVHTDESLHPKPNATANTWHSNNSGLFSPLPHLLLTEQYWHEESAVLTRRYYVVDAASCAVTRYAQSMQAYTLVQYEQLLANAGFRQIRFMPGLAHDQIPVDADFQVLVAQKPT